jgi:OmcA/MtrC family decaheme c-type cytochrome
MVPTIPADAKGTWSVSLEGRREVVLPVRGTTTVTARDTGNNQVFYFSVDRTPVTPRRAVVSLAKCNACHGKLAFHGQVRNSTDHCVVCHNPNRLAGTGAAAQSVSMQLMIHKIHRASGLSRDYIIGTTNFRNGGFPGIISNCSGCHVNGSENLPLIEGLLPVQDPKGLINPAQPTTAACMSCHDGRQAAAHAALNTSPTLGEACSTCHGPTSAYSVAKSHAR